MEKILNFCKIGGKRVEKFDGKRKYIATGDIINNKIKSYEWVSFENKPSRANQEVRVGDVLFAKMKDTVKVLQIDEENVNNIYSTGFFVITPNKNVNSKYLYWLFNSQKFNKEKNMNCKGATQKALNLENFSKIYINKLPIYEEQEAIINRLDKVQEVVDLRKKQIEELEELIKSQFVEMFGTKEDGFKCSKTEFNNCIKNMLKGPFGSDIKKSLYVPKTEDTYKVYIQINAINKNQTLGDYWISKEYFDRKMFKFELKPKDYIVTCDGTLGKLLRLDENMERGIISASLLRITLDENVITPEYFENVWSLFMLDEMKKDIRNACLTHLPSAKVIGKIKIPLPSMEKQNKFSTIIKQINKSKSELNKNLKEMENLQGSLMNKYFL